MSPKRLLKIILWILVGLFFIIGIPVLINGAYKYGESYGPIFITLWDAEAALSYYGSVLGAVITGASLFVTIRFTRNYLLQFVLRESKLNVKTTLSVKPKNGRE